MLDADSYSLPLKGNFTSKVECSIVVQAEKPPEFTVRGRMDIIADVLNVAKHGVKKTKIMYTCNLSFKQLRIYLDFLLKRDFIALVSMEEGKYPLFKTTKKGVALLKAYYSLQAVISS